MFYIFTSHYIVCLFRIGWRPQCRLYYPCRDKQKHASTHIHKGFHKNLVVNHDVVSYTEQICVECTQAYTQKAADPPHTQPQTHGTKVFHSKRCLMLLILLHSQQS